MPMTLLGLRKRLLSFLRAEAGSATVEFTLWVPVVLAVLMLGADASTAFTRQSNLWRLSHETARIVSRHALDAEAGAAFARKRMQIGNYTPEVEVTVDDATQTVTVSVTVDAEEIAPFGLLSPVLDAQISFVVAQTLEPV